MSPRLPHRKDNEAASGIQFVTDEKGREVAAQIDLKKYGSVMEDLWDGLISESRCKEKAIPLEKIKADFVKRGWLRGYLCCRGKATGAHRREVYE